MVIFKGFTGKNLKGPLSGFFSSDSCPKPDNGLIFPQKPNLPAPVLSLISSITESCTCNQI